MIAPDDPSDLDENGCYRARNAMHKWMAPPEHCERCNGRGWRPSVDDNGDEDGEVYCDCAAGTLRHRIEVLEAAPPLCQRCKGTGWDEHHDEPAALSWYCECPAGQKALAESSDLEARVAAELAKGPLPAGEYAVIAKVRRPPEK